MRCIEEPLTALHKPTLLIAAAAAPFQSSQASCSAARHQPASTFSTSASPAHPAKLRAQSTAQASAPGPPQPQPQAPALAAGQSPLPQRLVLTSQAQARLPSKWPCLPGFCRLFPQRGCIKKRLCCPLPPSLPCPSPQIPGRGLLSAPPSHSQLCFLSELPARSAVLRAASPHIGHQCSGAPVGLGSS